MHPKKFPKLLSQLLVCASFLLVASDSFALTFNVVSFNTWGVPFAVKDTWRYAAAMKQIETLSPDFVFLEELFSGKGRRAFQSEMYPYVVNGPHAFPKIVPGGIRLLSKYPVLRSAKMHYKGCLADDCLSKKGALLAVVELPDGQRLNLVGTHLNARGDDSVRINQLDQLKNFIEEFAEPTAPILISGDFNYNPDSTAYAYSIEHLGVKDAWTAIHAASDPGITYDTVNNPYAHDYCIQHNFPLTQERIDFNLIKGD
jgi:endonuclease/exonuclease/phosphatase family metal-dependent hydrolase